MARREYNRSDRIAAEMRREVSLVVHEAVRNGELPSVSVSEVEVTRDVSLARVYVTARVAAEGAAAVKLLNEHAKEFRHELAKTLKLRHMPELRFAYDDSVDRGERIEQLLRDVDKGPAE
jgi:ribosome-binding factor A